jgi:16S rRNA (guanine966-N2)-methyltransferase
MNRHSKASGGGKPGGKPGAKVGAANRVRIIGGLWRSRQIDFPDGDGLRPTANRVRETLFNWLGQTLHDRRCLDLFAGSGALGFEAASRGASEVLMIEKNVAAAAALQRNREKLAAAQCRVIAGDALQFLAADRARFDLILLDPPFASGLMPALLAELADHLLPQGLIYAEWGEPLDQLLAAMPNCPWQLVKQARAGAVHFALLRLAA